MKSREIFIGLSYAALWASASVASKFGLRDTGPFFLYFTRLMSAGLIILLGCSFFMGYLPKPKKIEIRSLVILAFFNTTLYLSCFVYAIKTLAAGIGTLGVGTGPLMVSFFAAIYGGQKVSRSQIWYLFMGFLGVAMATYPLILEQKRTGQSLVDPLGLLILMCGVLSVSGASVYYTKLKFEMPRIAIIGWQTLLGAVFMAPLLFFEPLPSTLTVNYWSAVLWLIGPVSVVAVLLYFTMLSIDPIKASFWLFLTPIFGFIYANILLNEPITAYTIAGLVLVISSLYLSQRR